MVKMIEQGLSFLVFAFAVVAFVAVAFVTVLWWKTKDKYKN